MSGIYYWKFHFYFQISYGLMKSLRDFAAVAVRLGK
jgi:hypothetical protein